MTDLLPAYRRADALPGIEVMEAYNRGSQWAFVTTIFGVAMPMTWAGEAFHERRVYSVGCGAVFCNEPGDAFHIARVHRQGLFKNLLFEPQALRELLAEHDIHHEPQWLRRVHTMSPELMRRLFSVYSAYSAHSAPMHLQTSVTELVAVMAEELIDSKGRQFRRPFEPSSRAAERLREALHDDDQPTLDLAELAAKVGMTRFRALRVFKRQFGLTPHEYQICLRISQARDLLKRGHSSAEVAAHCGFSDQSHFIRHFKRRLGVTPKQYVQAGRAEVSELALRAAGLPR
jgi:AraC-like DNA-binding protein